MDLGNQLKAYRQLTGMTQRELAEKLDSSAPNISRLEADGPVSEDLRARSQAFLDHKPEVAPPSEPPTTRRILLVGGGKFTGVTQFIGRLESVGMLVVKHLPTFPASYTALQAHIDGVVVFTSSPHTVANKAKALCAAAGVPVVCVDQHWSKALPALMRDGLVTLDQTVPLEMKKLVDRFVGMKGDGEAWVDHDAAMLMFTAGTDRERAALYLPEAKQFGDGCGYPASAVRRAIDLVKKQAITEARQAEREREAAEKKSLTPVVDATPLSIFGDAQPVTWSVASSPRVKQEKLKRRSTTLHLPMTYAMPEEPLLTWSVSARRTDEQDYWADVIKALEDWGAYKGKQGEASSEQIDLLKTHIGVLEIELQDEKAKSEARAVKAADAWNHVRVSQLAQEQLERELVLERDKVRNVMVKLEKMQSAVRGLMGDL